MKIRCKFKDPDTMPDAVADAVAEMDQPAGITPAEWVSIRNERICLVQAAIERLWMEYGEYLDVEFDTEARTATILPRGTIK